MKINKSTKVSLRIIALFTIAICLSFIPELLHNFFGDWWCEGSGARTLVAQTQTTYEHYEYAGCKYETSQHIAQWHWGYRHWLWLCMGISLVIVQIVNIIQVINEPETV